MHVVSSLDRSVDWLALQFLQDELSSRKYVDLLTFVVKMSPVAYTRFFKNKNFNSARLFARLTPVFLFKKRPSSARHFSNMGMSEELGTLQSPKRIKTQRN